MNLNQQHVVLNVLSVGNHDPKTCDCVKRTCGYLGNPLQRPMVHGRHVEIASRAKNLMNGMAEDEQ